VVPSALDIIGECEEGVGCGTVGAAPKLVRGDKVVFACQVGESARYNFLQYLSKAL